MMKLKGFSRRTIRRIKYLQYFLREGIRKNANGAPHMKVHHILLDTLDACNKEEIRKESNHTVNILLIVSNANFKISDCICESLNSISPDAVQFLIAGRCLGEHRLWKSSYDIPVWEVRVMDHGATAENLSSNLNLFSNMSIQLHELHIPYHSGCNPKPRNKSRLGWYAYLRALIRASSYR